MSRCARGISEVLFAGRGEADEVAAAVGGVALARDEARVGEVRVNDYDFVSERALDACSAYGVESISLTALRDT